MGKKLKQAWVNSKFILSQKKFKKIPAKKNSQLVKLSIPQTTHRKPRLLIDAVVSGYIATSVVQGAVPSVTGIAL